MSDIEMSEGTFSEYAAVLMLVSVATVTFVLVFLVYVWPFMSYMYGYVSSRLYTWLDDFCYTTRERKETS
jgi:hypothetical protein